jgi:hypothetical protein
MATKLKDGEYSLNLSGSGVSIDRAVSEHIALQIVQLAMGGTSGSDRGGAGAVVNPGAGQKPDTSTPKAFMAAKQPKTDMERVTCLAYYLTHTRATPKFKTKALTDLNLEAAAGKISNISATARNAATPSNNFLSGAGGGNKQITVRGEALVEALPDREMVQVALDARPARKPRKKHKGRKKK